MTLFLMSLGTLTSPTGMEERWALGIQEQEPEGGALGGGSWDGLSPPPALELPGGHQAWVRSTCRVTWGHTVSSPGDMDYREVKVK